MPSGLAGGVPERVGNYSGFSKLGEGTFGVVLKSSHRIAGEKVAVKVLEKRRMQQADDIERVGREIQILKQLRHPHVVRLWEIIYAQDRIYLVMEYCPRGELFQHIVKQGRLREDEGKRFFAQIVAGVAYLHSMHVVHRDIKPENLLLDSERHIRIADFGLSTRCAPGQVLKHACGSPCYAAPEMLTRAGQASGYVGHPVDVWSTGVTLFAMICGFLPFEHANTSALYKKIIAGEYALPPFLSREAKDLLKRLLTTEPTRRISLEHAASHPWCAHAADAVLQPSQHATGVARLAAESDADGSILQQMESEWGYSLMVVAKDIAEGKHSEASATYWLLRLRALRSGGAAVPSARGARPQSGLAERAQSHAATRRGPPPPAREGKENHHAAAEYDTPTKKLTRSPKPLTLLNAVAVANEARRSSPGLFKVQPGGYNPAGAAHAAARAARGDARDDALLAFRERMRAGGGTAYETAKPPASRPSSARGRHAGAMAPRCAGPMPPSVPQPPQNTYGSSRPQSRCGVQRHGRDPSPRDPSPRDGRAVDAPGQPPSRRGADFRQRKYTQTGRSRIDALVSAR